MKKHGILFSLTALLLTVGPAHAQLFNTFETDSGSISLGPASSNSAHIFTDRPKFLFNKDVYSYKGGFSSHGIYDLLLMTNGTPRLTIDKDSGFVGIGTLKPKYTLEVEGSAYIHHNLLVQEDLEVYGQIKFFKLPTVDSKDISFLGIGPSGTLGVMALDYIASLMYPTPIPCTTDNNGNYPEAIWSNNGESPNPKLYTGSHCPAKVGIGTANPQAKLHVNGNAKIQLGLEVGVANIADSKLKVRNDAIFDKRVAIGTDPQNGYDLAVCGKIWAGEVKVNAVSDWCDYVFEDDYNLKSLQEVESFIEQHKHLPEIPSAVEIETEGINVSEMLQLMMKKIEELTLYTIEQDKRIKEIENSK